MQIHTGRGLQAFNAVKDSLQLREGPIQVNYKPRLLTGKAIKAKNEALAAESIDSVMAGYLRKKKKRT